MILYKSKSAECLDLLAKEGIGDWNYRASCTLDLVELVFSSFMALGLFFALFCFYCAFRRD